MITVIIVCEIEIVQTRNWVAMYTFDVATFSSSMNVVLQVLIQVWKLELV